MKARPSQDRGRNPSNPFRGQVFTSTSYTLEQISMYAKICLFVTDSIVSHPAIGKQNFLAASVNARS